MLLKSETISKYEIVFTYVENNFQQTLFQNRDFFRRASRAVNFLPSAPQAQKKCVFRNTTQGFLRVKSAPQARKNHVARVTKNCFKRVKARRRREKKIWVLGSEMWISKGKMCAAGEHFQIQDFDRGRCLLNVSDFSEMF